MSESTDIHDGDAQDGAEAAPLDDVQQTRKNRSESPGSESETRAKQADPVPEGVDDDIDRSSIRAVPGTGGPDDEGDVDVDPDQLHLPGRD